MFVVVSKIVKLRRFSAGQLVLAAFLNLVCTQSIVLAQSVELSIGTGSGTAGGTVSIPINLTSSGAAQITGLQWTFNYSSDITGVTVYAGPSATRAQKYVSCSGTRCLILGFNNNVLPDGTIAVATFQIATYPSNTTIPIALTYVVSPTVTGATVPASGGSGTISLFAPVAASGTPPITSSGANNCAEFQVALDGRCMAQNLIPWVTFGGVWESRLKMGNVPNGSNGGPVQLSFNLLPAIAITDGRKNHIPAFFSDNRSLPAGQLQIGEGAVYSLLAGESVDVRFLYPPAGCDSHGENCGSTPDPSILSYGSLLVQYFATSPAYLRGLAKAEITLLAKTGGSVYGWQATEKEAPPARMWKAPVEVTFDKNANSLTRQEVAAAVSNPGTQAVTITATLYDQYGKSVTSKDFAVASLGAIGFTFSDDQGFGSSVFPQHADFTGWVTFEVTSPSGGTVNLLVLQLVGDSISSVDVQSFP